MTQEYVENLKRLIFTKEMEKFYSSKQQHLIQIILSES